MALWLEGLTNDKRRAQTAIIPCDGNGDIYYQIAASGSGTLDLEVEVWAYWM